MAKLTVTITREGSGKVVKMGDDAIVGHGRMNGNRRFLHNKRHRTDGAEWRSNTIRGKVSRIAPGKDLRFKLMRKRRSLRFRDAFEDRRKDSEKLLKHVHPPQNLSNPSRITCDGLHIYSMQTADESRGFPKIPQTIPIALARNDLFSSTVVLDPSRESGPVPDREKAITSRPVTYVAPMSSILQRKPHVVCFLACNSFIFFIWWMHFVSPTFPCKYIEDRTLGCECRILLFSCTWRIISNMSMSGNASNIDVKPGMKNLSLLLPC